MFRALLLAIWHDLSDVKLGEALDDRASFRWFCGFARSELTPERTAFVRFRRELLHYGLDHVLFDEITTQLKTKAIRVKTGTLMDATVVGSASEGDEEAKWSGPSIPKGDPRLQSPCRRRRGHRAGGEGRGHAGKCS